MTKSFTHLHLHTESSFLDGLGSAEEKVLMAKELGHKALAITDHNHLLGLVEFQDACKKHDIKMIPGVELYWTWDAKTISSDKKDRDKVAMERAEAAGVDFYHPVEYGKNGKPKKRKKLLKAEIAELIKPYAYDTKNYHLIVFAKNQKGLENLIALQSEAAEVGLFNARYHCDNEMLKKYSEGLMISTACIGSVIADSFKKDNDEVAEELLKEWIDIFGAENVFCEIQGLDWDVQHKVNKKMIKYADKLGIKLIATNDSHYTRREDIEAHDVILCIGTGKLVSDTNRMRYEPEFWMKNYDEMIYSFERLGGDDEEYMTKVREALDNTNLVADMVEDNIKLGSDVDLFPNVDIPVGYTEGEWLRKVCWKELYKFLAKDKKLDKRRVYEERLRSELDVIVKKGFSGYILTVQDAIVWGDKNGAPFGPGRGSGAGSLVLFLLDIVKGTDPVEYNLLFSRFLTEDRTSPPDIDSDVSYTGRQNLINYLQDKYGHEYISQVGTITRLGVKNGIKDVGKALGYSFSDMNLVTKQIDDIMNNAPSYSFKDLDKLADNEKTVELYNKVKQIEAEYSEIFAFARKFEGTPRNTGIHAGGVLITPMPINKIFPTKMSEGRKVTLWDKDVVERLGGIKFDYLGLKTVSVIDLCLEYIAKSTGTEKMTLKEMYENIPTDEKESFEMIRNKNTEAVFQIESDLFKGMISDMQPENINDIIALTALGRPGPLSAGMDKAYNNRKNGLEPIVYPLPNLEDILSDSYGTIIYQEHCMLIAKKIAGFDDNQADSYLRKALAKSHKEKMELCRRWLIYGKRNEPIPEGYDNENPNSVMYDPTGKYGSAIKGAINNGYDEEELIKFWDMLKDYSSYLFNKSHSTSYSLVTIITAYLKKHYPTEFWAALLTIQDDKDKRAVYLKLIEKEGIKIELCDINSSMREFIPVPEENKILFGLTAVNGLGDASIDAIIENRPYASLEEAIEKIPKKGFNKTNGVAIIMAGGFDKIYGSDKNRMELINEFYTIRKDKDVELLNTDNELITPMYISFETQTLGTPLTFKPWWDEVEVDAKVTVVADIKDVREKIDRNGNMMAFIKIESDGCKIDGVVFSKTYCAHSDKFDVGSPWPVVLQLVGKKDDRGQLIVNTVKYVK